ncbi:MAG: Coenzyme F420-dependent N5N10-methenyltetrahydromethanopterin dehydrogenase Mtd [Candidatus Methanohalarchaeum thermophilum]|uniref:F420-dependent methylenetetrahydromethanopterin dehydrogenase n=1 Tax=Methanohalarchaeum thermophilum TaxID=1903181 RepID=A0A1Q6DUD9_METT1|nr:MAG: Coenzyme F420-dependent N5N10-methenyltetrahydromethanopterin dehydrogenase Mtd [Candidatus Methanohalarchaeum thermophilum]
MNVGVAKFGNIGSSFIDLLLDERATRKNLEIKVAGSGSKLDKKSCLSALDSLLNFDLDLVLIISPNPKLKGPKAARKKTKKQDIPVIVIGDVVDKDLKNELEENKFGYILLKNDPLIGARREFLDPIEMADFNSNILKILALSGVFRKIQSELDQVINQPQENKNKLPNIVIDEFNATKNEFDNPYARYKAIGALKIAKSVDKTNLKGCYKYEDPDKYIPTVASTHEMLKAAKDLVEEAREIEKSNDTVKRTPHKKNGNIIEKRKIQK